MAKTKSNPAPVAQQEPVEERIYQALNRIAAALERQAPAATKPTGTLNPPTGPIPKYEAPPVKEKAGTLAEETAKLHEAVAAQKAETPKAEAPKPDPVAGLLGEEPTTPAGGRVATFDEARTALMEAAKDRPKGLGADKVLAILKETLGVERLSLHPKEDKAGFGRFVAALDAALGRK